MKSSDTYIIFHGVFFVLNLAFICMNISMFSPYIMTLVIPGIVSMCAECSGEDSCKSHDMHYTLSYVIISILSTNKRNLRQYIFSVYHVFRTLALWYHFYIFTIYFICIECIHMNVCIRFISYATIKMKRRKWQYYVVVYIIFYLSMNQSVTFSLGNK